MSKFQSMFGLGNFFPRVPSPLADPFKRNNDFKEAKAILENRGLTLSEDQWTHIIDLANATGKSLSELANAITDAMIGENERLKCFGPQGRIVFDRIKQHYSGNNI